MKKFQVALFWAVISALALVSISTYRQAGTAKRQMIAARAALLNFNSTAPVDSLFAQARATPSAENLSALHDALWDRTKKYEALIQLHRDKIDELPWASFERRPPHQAFAFFLNLAGKHEIGKEDWATFDRIAQIWQQSEQNLQRDIGFLQLSHPSSFTHQYVTLLQELNTLVPGK